MMVSENYKRKYKKLCTYKFIHVLVFTEKRVVIEQKIHNRAFAPHH